MGGRLRAPYPWSGGKGRWVDEINARLGEDVQTFAEPCAGSLAVMLSRAPAKREIATDTSSLLVNAWRAMAADPLAVAEVCDWPTFHDDLIARRKWLSRWSAANRRKVQDDPFFFDPVAAGFWIWCMSHAIRGNADIGWHPGSPDSDRGGGGDAGRAVTYVPDMNTTQPSGKGTQAHRRPGPNNAVPAVRDKGGGIGVQSHRNPADSVPMMKGSQGVQAGRAGDGLPQSVESIPAMASNRGRTSRGVCAQRDGDKRTGEGRPNLKDASPGAGTGVQAQRAGEVRSVPSMYPDGASKGKGVQAFRGSAGAGDPGGFPSPERWGSWFEMLARRLKQVIILNRPWQAAVTPAALAARAGGVVAVLLDPPYITAGRSKMYESDGDSDAVDTVARETYEWARKHGDVYRIAYCHTAGSFDFPESWEVLTKRYTGTNADERTVDAIAFSPACLKVREESQEALF